MVAHHFQIESWLAQLEGKNVSKSSTAKTALKPHKILVHWFEDHYKNRRAFEAVLHFFKFQFLRIYLIFSSIPELGKEVVYS